jgi:hypothetical protein
MTRLAARRSSASSLAASAAVLVAALARPAAAGPVIEVRARTAITVEPIRRVRGATTIPPMIGLVVHGRLHERGSGEPVAHATGMSVSLDGELHPVEVDEDGNFDTLFTAESGRHHLSVEYPGDSRFEGSRFALPELDVAKQPLKLSLRAPDHARRARGPLELEVQASDEAEPVQVRIAIRLGSAEAEELHEVGRATTDELGRAPISVPIDQLGPPGPKRIVAHFAGDEVYDPASAEASFLLVTETRIQLEIDDAGVAFEGRLRGRGKLTDDLGAGLAGEPVSLMAEDQEGRRSLDDALTGPDGTFVLDAPASELGAGPHMVQAVFESPRSYLEVSRSATVTRAGAERRPVPVGYSLAAFAATAASIVAFVALRTRPWTRWLARLRGKSAGPPLAAGEKRDAPPHTGLALARPGLVSTLRRPHDRGFTGAVADAVTGDAIAGAHVQVGSSEPMVTDAAGRFAIEELPEGDHHAEVTAAGYVSERFALTIPHRGELRDTRVDLLPVRERIFQMYREVAEPLLPSPELWGVWTPRQIFDHVRRARRAGDLAELTSYVEEKYFSSRRPDEPELEGAAARVAAARAEAAPDRQPVDPAKASEYSPGP